MSLQNPRLVYDLYSEEVDVVGCPAALPQTIHQERSQVSGFPVGDAGVDLLQALIVQPQ